MKPEAVCHYLKRQQEWSLKTFGGSNRTHGILNHIRKELGEIEKKPFDLMEWIDVMILALDGYWRHGGSPETIWRHLVKKQAINFAREWPPVQPPDVATEHIREESSPTIQAYRELCDRVIALEGILENHEKVKKLTIQGIRQSLLNMLPEEIDD